MTIWNTIESQLKENNKLVLLVVVSHKGSSPGRQGFKMIVTENGQLIGSIGGGKTEFELANQAKELLKEDSFKPFLVNQVHRNKDKDSSGMICTGEQLVLFYPFKSNQLKTVQQIITQNNGSFKLTQSDITLTDAALTTSNYNFKQSSESEWVYAENINKKPNVYVFGGGHVGLATSKLLVELGFNVHVFECRNGINTFENNSYVQSKSIIDYTDVLPYIQEGENNYVVLVTHGYITDKLILKQLLNKPFKYVGMLGSEAKVKQTFNSIIEDGFSKEDLKPVFSPIGIPIKSQTPTEIAVSICAEIIKVKNEKL